MNEGCGACIIRYNDVIMGVIASPITSLTIVYPTVYSHADQRKHKSSASLAFHPGPVNSTQKWPVTRKRFPFDDVIMPYHEATYTRVQLRIVIINNVALVYFNCEAGLRLVILIEHLRCTYGPRFNNPAWRISTTGVLGVIKFVGYYMESRRSARFTRYWTFSI